MNFTIDAKDKILGRLASEVAMLLRGKNAPNFEPNRLIGNRVTVYNTDLLRVTGKKLIKKVYLRHSGYHGGQKARTLGDAMANDSRDVLRRAVWGMLPKNKLRSRMIINLMLIRSNLKE